MEVINKIAVEWHDQARMLCLDRAGFRNLCEARFQGLELQLDDPAENIDDPTYSQYWSNNDQHQLAE